MIKRPNYFDTGRLVMIKRPFYFGLLTEQGEAPVTTSGAPVAAATPTGEPPPAAPAQPSVIDRAMSAFRAKGELVKEITDANAKLAALTTERDGLLAQVTALTAERDGLKAQFNQLEQALNAAQTEAKTVEQAAVNQLAALGVPEQNLPAAAASSGPVAQTKDEKIESLQERIKSENDPAKIATMRAEVLKLYMGN